MKFAIITGSHRAESESGRVGRYVKARIQNLVAHSSVYLHDLGKSPLPFWDEEVGGLKGHWQKDFAPVSKEFAEADAIVVVSPEWSGMVPAALKNFFLLCGRDELAHKPGLIVTVSASRNGVYPVTELRTSSYKNTRFCYIPEHIIVREVSNMFNGDTPSSEDDKYLRNRLDYSINLLHEYGKALRQVRESGLVDHKAYSNGM